MKNMHDNHGDKYLVLHTTNAPIASAYTNCRMIALRIRDNSVHYRLRDGRHPDNPMLDLKEYDTEHAATHIHSRIDAHIFQMIVRLCKMGKAYGRTALDLACVGYPGKPEDMAAYLKGTYGCEI